MNQSNIAELLRRFPNFWKLDKFMFECDDGWFELVYNLCLRLERAGFQGKCVQLKEKWGSLCFYTDFGAFVTPSQQQIIFDAEAESESWCEVCGSPFGKLRNDTMFVQTRCNYCQKEYKRYHPQ